MKKRKIYPVKPVTVRLYWMLVLGILCLFVSIPIRTGIAYPAYELLEKYGTNIQNMVMFDVVGTEWSADAVTDCIGYILLFLVGCALLIPVRRRILTVVTGAGFAAALLCDVLPFFASGVNVLAGEFLLHWAALILKGCAMAYLIIELLPGIEGRMIHQENVQASVSAVLAALAGVIREIAAFYGFHTVSVVYMVVQGILSAVCLYLIGICVYDKKKRLAGSCEQENLSGGEASETTK